MGLSQQICRFGLVTGRVKTYSDEEGKQADEESQSKVDNLPGLKQHILQIG